MIVKLTLLHAVNKYTVVTGLRYVDMFYLSRVKRIDASVCLYNVCVGLRYVNSYR